MIDAVLSYHADPISCGVTRFSQQLARRLDVPWGTLDEWPADKRTMVSVKFAEIPAGARMTNCLHSDLFLHDTAPTLAAYLPYARRVFTANQAIADTLRGQHPNIIPAWCPSLVEAQPREPITVLSMGMAHKIRTDLYATLKEKLDATGEPYVVYISAALHEGTTFSDAAQSFETLRKLFGMTFVFLGTLSDEAMVDRLRTCTYVAAFFEKGLRENNTSVMAAIDNGAKVLTNHDERTPGQLTMMTHDIRNGELPHMWKRRLHRLKYGWEPLVELIRHA